MQPYPIQQGLWECLDGVLFNKALALAKDIAAELGVPPQALIDILKKEEKGKFAIVPDEEPLYQCKALVPYGPTYMRCRHTTFGEVCSSHSQSSVTPATSSLEPVQRITAPESIYFVNTAKQVYSMDGRPCGILKGTTLTVFEIVSV